MLDLISAMRGPADRMPSSRFHSRRARCSDWLVGPITSRVCTGVAVLIASLCIAHPASADEHLIDDFESAQSLASWSFSNGPEFPGATGSLTTGPGHSGQGAHLAYDFSAGGAYVSATLALDPAISAAAVSLWVKSEPGIRVTIRVTDETGQTLQFAAKRPLYAWNANDWYRLVIPIGASSNHWGGADDGVLHGSVRALGVLAADPVESGVAGSIDFDDVGWLDDLTFAIDPATLERAPVPAGSESLRDRLGANIHFTSDDQALDALQEAGFAWVRMDMFWGWVEQQGVYDFSPYDGLVAALEARDMKAHFILCYSHPDHASGQDWAPQTPEEITAFGDYAEAAATHFAGKPVQFEVWNEANLDGFWKPVADVTQYAALAKEAIHRVHTGNPAALVSTTGTAGVDIEFLRSCLSLGCADEADAIGVHPYRIGGPESAAEDILLLRSIINASLPGNPPVWDTEWGYSSTWYGDGHASESRHRQAVLAAREMLTSWALGFPIAVYYDVRDDGTDPEEKEHNFGLLANDYTDKPAMVAMRTLSTIAEGRELGAFGLATPTTLHVMELEGSSDRAYAIWSSAEGTASTIDVPQGSQAVDMLGGPIPLGPGASQLTIAEEAGPVYLIVPKPEEPDGGTGDAAVDSPLHDADSVDGSGGAAASDGGVPDSSVSDGGAKASAEEDGCACYAAGAPGHGPAWWIPALGVALYVARRRRIGSLPRRHS